MSENGLMTLNKLQQKLFDGITEHHIWQKYLGMKKDKVRLEELLLNQEYSHEDIPRIQAKLIHNEEAHLLESLHLDTSQLKKIIHILENYSDQTDVLNSGLIFFFKFLSNKKILSKAIKYAKKQSRYLKKSNFNRFLDAYNKEKVFFYNSGKEFLSLKFDNSIFETIRARNKTMVFSSAGKNTVKLIGALASIVLTFTICSSVYTGEILDTHALLFTGSAFTLGLNHYLSFLRNNIEKTQLRENIPSNAIEIAVEINRKFGVFVYGIYSYNEIKYLQEALEEHYPAEVKRFLKYVIFRGPDMHKGILKLRLRRYFDVEHDAHFDPRLCSIAFNHSIDRQTIFHEVSHARTDSVSSHFRHAWKLIDDANVSRKEARSRAKFPYGSGWKNFPDQPAFGYMSTYGLTNIDEDIATFVEQISRFKFITNERGISVHDVDMVKPYLHTYFEKADLLLKYGFITSHNHSLFLQWMKKINSL